MALLGLYARKASETTRTNFKNGFYDFSHRFNLYYNKAMNTFYRALPRWLPWAVGLTLVFSATYAMGQQILRQSANDPQIQIAEDATAAIAAAEPVSFFNSPTKTDIAESLTPYLIIYDSTGAPVASTGILNGTVPTLPSGVLRSALASGESRLTWQPRPGVRSAIVVIPVKGIFSGFVVAGRSLREIEKREDNIGWLLFAAWGFSLIVMLGMFMLVEKNKIPRVETRG